MKVAIMTMFQSLKETYSLVQVVKAHVQMLLAQNISVKIIVSEKCQDHERHGLFEDQRIEWIKMPEMYQEEDWEWQDYYDEEITLPPQVEEKVQIMAGKLEEVLQDVQICMLHDILYQSKHYLHNKAIRWVQQCNHQLRFIAFTHSFPLNRPVSITERNRIRYTPMPHTVYAYPTRAGIKALATQYGVPQGACHVVYHPIELLETMSEAVLELHRKSDLLAPDLLIVYPTRLTTGKQLEHIVQLAGALSTLGNLTAKVIYCDFVAKDTDPKVYKGQIREIGTQYGLSESEIIFTSDYGYSEGFPHQSVLELFQLSNLYICPSMSESFGLTVLEAAKAGNFVVLNENVPALKEIGKLIGAYFMQWGGRCMGYNVNPSYEINEATYYGLQSKYILALLGGNGIYLSKTKVRQQFNAEWIWKNQLRPMIEQLLEG